MPDAQELFVTVHLDGSEERKLIADFIRFAHCMMSTNSIASAIENGTYLEIMAEKNQKDFEKSLEGE